MALLETPNPLAPLWRGFLFRRGCYHYATIGRPKISAKDKPLRHKVTPAHRIVRWIDLLLFELRKLRMDRGQNLDLNHLDTSSNPFFQLSEFIRADVVLIRIKYLNELTCCLQRCISNRLRLLLSQ